MNAPRWFFSLLAPIFFTLSANSAIGKANSQALPPEITEALEAMLQCERPAGGWMYACDRSKEIA